MRLIGLVFIGMTFTLMVAVGAVANQYSRTITDVVEVTCAGDAQVTRTETVVGDTIQTAYATLARQESQSRETSAELRQGIADEIYVLFGAQPSSSDVSVEEKLTAKGTFERRTATIRLPGLLKQLDSGSVLNIRQFGDSQLLQDYVHCLVNTILGQAMYLGPNDTFVLRHTMVLHFEEGCPVVLYPTQPTRWALDLGGGNTMTSSLSYMDKQTLQFVEEMVQTAQAPARFLDSGDGLAYELLTFGAARVGVGNVRAEALTPQAPGTAEAKGVFNSTWTFTIGGSFTTSFGGSGSWTAGSPGETCVSGTAGAELAVSLEGDTELVVTIHIKVSLPDFWNSVITVHIDSWHNKLAATVSIPLSLSLTWGDKNNPVNVECDYQNVWSLWSFTSPPYSLLAGIVPIDVVFHGEAKAYLTAHSDSYAILQASKKLESTHTLTLDYDSGWSYSFTNQILDHPVTFSTDTKVSADATFGVTATVSALVDYLAGPFLSTDAYASVAMEEPPFTPQSQANEVGYAIGADADLNGGITLAPWLSNWFNIPPWTVNLLHLGWPIAQGLIPI